MKRLIIVCEGPTEVEFCHRMLEPYFWTKGIIVETPLIKKSGGGIVPWANLKRQIENHLKNEKHVIVTTFIDFYGIKASFNFPDWDECKKIADKLSRMDAIEHAMKLDIAAALQFRFIPYLQLHEFEGLLFNNMDAFDNLIPSADFIDRGALIDTIQEFPNPELINDSPENAPSLRLKRLVRGYNKVLYGSMLAEEIGLDMIRSKSIRFNKWIEKLEMTFN